MHVTLDIPEDIYRAFAAGSAPLDRVALEGLAAEGYRAGVLSESQMMRLLQLGSRFAVHDWLRERHIPFGYTEADLSADLATAKRTRVALTNARNRRYEPIAAFDRHGAAPAFANAL